MEKQKKNTPGSRPSMLPPSLFHSKRRCVVLRAAHENRNDVLKEREIRFWEREKWRLERRCGQKNEVDEGRWKTKWIMMWGNAGHLISAFLFFALMTVKRRLFFICDIVFVIDLFCKDLICSYISNGTHSFDLNILELCIYF